MGNCMATSEQGQSEAGADKKVNEKRLLKQELKEDDGVFLTTIVPILCT